MYTLTFSEAEMDFFRQLMQSGLPVTINTVELVAALKGKILTAKPDPLTVPAPSDT